MPVLSRLLLACAATLLIAAPLESQVQQGSTNTPAMRPGDAIRITVWRRPELSGEFTVAPDGSILHPLFRAVQVAGVALPVAEQRLATFLTQFDAAPAFVLEPLVRVVISGQVDNPNVYHMRLATSVAQAVALAGGTTDRGNSRRVQLLRDGRLTEIDLTQPGGAGAQLLVQSGDQILVPRQRAMFREVVTPTLTAVGAVAAVVNVILRAR